MKTSPVAYMALWLLLAYWTIKLLTPTAIGTTPWIFLDNLNLLIHEAGHWLWLPMGQFMAILGGSLTQCLMPTLFGGYFIWRRELAGVSFCLFWLGDTLVNVGYYAADGQSMILPLLGGDGAIHDWNWLLAQLHIVSSAELIGSFIKAIGYLASLVSLACLAIVVIKDYISKA